MNDAGRSAQPSAASDARGVYRRLLGYVRPHRGTFALGMLGGVLFAATDGELRLVRQALRRRHLHRSRDPRAVALGAHRARRCCSSCAASATTCQTYFLGYVGRQVIKGLRARAVRAVPAAARSAYYDRGSSGALLSRLTYNIEQVAKAATNSVTIADPRTLTIVGSIGLLFYLNCAARAVRPARSAPLIAGWSRSSTGSSAATARASRTRWATSRAWRRRRSRRRASSRCSTRRTTRARQFETVNEHNRRSHMRLILHARPANPVVQFIASIGLAVVLSSRSPQAIHGQLTPGELHGFPRRADQHRAAARSARERRRAAAAGHRRRRRTSSSCSMSRAEPQGGPRALPRVRGEVEFRDVSLRLRRREGRGAARRSLRGATPARRSRSSGRSAAASRRW